MCIRDRCCPLWLTWLKIPTNLLIKYIIMGPCVMQKNWFTIFNVKVTVRAYITKLWLFLLYLLNCWSICNQTWYDSTTSYPRVFCAKIGFLDSRSRSQQRFKMLVNVCPDNIFWTTDHFDTKLDMVRQHHEPKCHEEKLVCCLQCQGHSEGLYNQNMIISTLSSNLLVCLQPNSVW